MTGDMAPGPPGPPGRPPGADPAPHGSSGRATGGATSGGVDLETLADYAAGVLGSGEAARVADLIATDPRWGRAHAALVAADAAVRADLRTAAASRPVMPGDIAARIDAALAAQSQTPQSQTPQSQTPQSQMGRRQTGRVVSLDAARTRRRRITAGLGAAAALIAFLGGVSIYQSGGFDASNARSDAAPAAGGAEAGAPPSAAPQGEAPEAQQPSSALVVPVIVSGRDYDPTTVAQLTGPVPTPPPAAMDAGGEPDPTTERAARTAAGGALARLADASALQDCLSAVTAQFPGTVGLVDFARYEGDPALLAVIRGGSGTTVVVVGPRCTADEADLLAALPS